MMKNYFFIVCEKLSQNDRNAEKAIFIRKFGFEMRKAYRELERHRIDCQDAV